MSAAKQRRPVASTLRRLGIATLLAVLAAPAALAQPTPQPAADPKTTAEPDYLDDRSTPEAVIRSLYNAIDRKEFARAWSYFRDEPDRPSYQRFAAGYETTAHVAVRVGKPRSEGAAGSIYYTLPVAIRSTATNGKRSVFTGCYELRIVQPGVQARPPFRPLGIVKGRLDASSQDFEGAMGTCPRDGL